jgi:hypothetical protein
MIMDMRTAWVNIFRDMTPYSPVVHRRFEEAYHLHLKSHNTPSSNKGLLGLLVDPDDGRSEFLRNVSELLPDYTASLLTVHSSQCVNPKWSRNKLDAFGTVSSSVSLWVSLPSTDQMLVSPLRASDSCLFLWLLRGEPSF